MKTVGCAQIHFRCTKRLINANPHHLRYMRHILSHKVANNIYILRFRSTTFKVDLDLWTGR